MHREVQALLFPPKAVKLPLTVHVYIWQGSSGEVTLSSSCNRRVSVPAESRSISTQQPKPQLPTCSTGSCIILVISYSREVNCCLLPGKPAQTNGKTYTICLPGLQEQASWVYIAAYLPQSSTVYPRTGQVSIISSSSSLRRPSFSHATTNARLLWYSFITARKSYYINREVVVVLHACIVGHLRYIMLRREPPRREL